MSSLQWNMPELSHADEQALRAGSPTESVTKKMAECEEAPSGGYGFRYILQYRVGGYRYIGNHQASSWTYIYFLCIGYNCSRRLWIQGATCRYTFRYLCILFRYGI